MDSGGANMKRDVQRAFVLLVLFFLLVFLLVGVDVQPIGPQGSSVGLATFNGLLHQFIGTHLAWYVITDWLGVAALLTAFGFAAAGLLQLIKGHVDVSFLILGAFYLLVIVLYLLFETVVINYRPLLLTKQLEASFPSSHTMIVLCIMGSASIEYQHFVTSKRLRIVLQGLSILVMLITVLGRLYSGVHWFTDVLGGVLLGSALVFLFRAAVAKRGRV